MRKLLLLCALSPLFLSCHSEAEETLPDKIAIINISTTVMSGTWRVTEYKDHGEDKTDHFTGYSFTFGIENELKATNGPNTYFGTWSVTNTENDDESPNDNIDFNIEFSAPAHFEDITDDWDVLSRTATKLVMIDVGSSGSVDNITFEKNE